MTARRTRRWLLAAAGLPVAFLVVLVAAWAIDMSAVGGEVVRNVSIDGRRVGGLDSEALLTEVGHLADDWVSAPVKLVGPEHTYETTAGDLGLEVDQQGTVDAVLDVGHTGAVPMRPVRWLLSFFDDRRPPVQFRVDKGALGTAVAALEGKDRTPPVEPTIVAGADGFEVTPGMPGSGIAVDSLARSLPLAAADGAPVTIVVGVATLRPQISDASARQAAAEANRLTSEPLEVTVGDTPVSVPPETLRSWLQASVGEGGLELQIDHDKVLADLNALAPEVGQPAVDARFDLVDGKPVVVPGHDGTACCQPDAPDVILAALRDGTGAVALQLVTSHPALTTDEASALGIVEEVGQPDAFGPTTHHAAGEPRVTNIHRIADLVRGAVIRPGETFSVNDYVGQRTAAKGFVDAPVIYQGTFQHDIGGGVSQFATTLFNAALYAGLDFGEYQSHSIEISRYPKGHEATISYPHPDLQLENTTPYGVLVWPTYTASSITVHLYSTHVVDVSLGSPTSRPQGQCTRWTTPRTRTYVDGHVVSDSVFAVYRPGEGVNC